MRIYQHQQIVLHVETWVNSLHSLRPNNYFTSKSDC